jgi:hypothetical protein
MVPLEIRIAKTSKRDKADFFGWAEAELREFYEREQATLKSRESRLTKSNW